MTGSGIQYTLPIAVGLVVVVAVPSFISFGVLWGLLAFGLAVAAAAAGHYWFRHLVRTRSDRGTGA